MALRNQPYLPLYIQDYLTDEKLNMCSLSTQGIYIKIMCILHKSEQYGCILLKQKDKQNESKYLDFAIKIAKVLPIEKDDIYNAIVELVEEGCLIIDGDLLYQKRMVKDNEISVKRAKAGKKGGEKTSIKQRDFALAKVEANTENEYENEYENNKEGVNKKKSFEDKFNYFIQQFNKISGRKFEGNDKAKRQFKARLNEGKTWNNHFKPAIINLYNDKYHKENSFKYATPEFITRPDKLEMYMNLEKEKKSNIYPGTIIKKDEEDLMNHIKSKSIGDC